MADLLEYMQGHLQISGGQQHHQPYMRNCAKAGKLWLDVA